MQRSLPNSIALHIVLAGVAHADWPAGGKLVSSLGDQWSGAAR